MIGQAVFSGHIRLIDRLNHFIEFFRRKGDVAGSEKHFMDAGRKDNQIFTQAFGKFF